MKVTVELADPLHKFAGMEGLVVELPHNATGVELLSVLNRQFAEVSTMNRLLVPGRAILFVNGEYADLETGLRDSDKARIVPYICCCHP